MTQQRRAEKEDQLLEAATHLFKEKGYHSTSMQELADAVGMQKGSLYYYIEGKDELLCRLMERATSFMAAQIDEVYASDLPPGRKLRWALETHAATMMEHLDLVAVFFHEYRNLPTERLAEAMAVRKRYDQVLMQIVEDGITAGEFRDVNVKMAVFGMLGMLNWTHQWFSPDGPFSSSEVATMLADFALHGLTLRSDR